MGSGYSPCEDDEGELLQGLGACDICLRRRQGGGLLYLHQKDECPDKYDFAPFVGFVFVDEAYRGQRLSGRMFDEAGSYAASLGYENIYVFSGEEGLYEKLGFVKLGDYETIYGGVEQLYLRKSVL